jgi:hypothetical protein
MQLACRNNGFVVQVAENDTLGRHLIATRDVKIGEVILQEEPLVAGPSQVTPPVCLGCYRLLTQECASPCPDCGWPVCDETCARASAHRAECDITKLKRGDKVQSLSAGVGGCRPTANKSACRLTTLVTARII